MTPLHDSIDRVITECVNPAKKRVAKFAASLSARYGDALDIEEIDTSEPQQVVHYMLDKIPIADYKYIMRQDPDKVAATLWRLFSDENAWLDIPGLDSETLSQFGGWQSQPGVRGAISRCKNLIDDTLSDPTILVVIRNEDDLLRAQQMH